MLTNKKCLKSAVTVLMIILLLSVFMIVMPGKNSDITTRGEAFFLNATSKLGVITDENSMKKAVMKYKSSLGGAVDIDFDRRVPTAFGEVYIFNQQYKGLSVFGRTLKAGVDKFGKMLFISGNYLKSLECINKSVLTAEQARTYAAEFGAAEIFGCESIVYVPSGVGYYAYSVITDLSGGTRLIIDAETGAMLASISLTTEEKAEVQAVDALGNTRTLTTDKTPSGYALYDKSRKIAIYDSKTNYEFSEELITSKDGSFSDDPAAVSLSYALALSYDFYANEKNIGATYLGADNSHNPNAPDYDADNQLETHAFLHYGYMYQNAAYVTGVPGYTDRDAVFIFGDGQSGGLLNLAAAADVVGHEYQHAVTDYNAGLIYQNQSGAISEAISDLFGALIEGYSMENIDFWLCAEDADDSGKGGLRDMSNPSRLGDPDKISNRKDYCYALHNHARSACDNGGVHSNSNILTHAFYLAYRGSLNSGQAITRENLGKLLFTTLSMLPPDVSFDAFAMYASKAVNMIGLSQTSASAMWESLAAGFNAVGIATEYDNQVTLTFSGGYGMPPAAVIVGKFNDTFIVPTIESTREGMELACWSADGSADEEAPRYYPGKEMKLPSKDMTLYPIYINSIWNGVTPTILEGAGKIYDPYLIKSAADLATVAYYVNANGKYIIESEQDFSGAHLKFTADIDMQNIPWIPIGISQINDAYLFVDGGGHSVSNLLVDGYWGYTGLFGIMSGSVQNLNIKNGLVKSKGGAAGGIVGSLWGGNISNCTNAADVVSIGDTLNPLRGSVGGIVGEIVFYGGVEVAVANCINTGNIYGANAGGIIGGIIPAWQSYSGDYYSYTFKTIANCINTGVVEGYIAGGIGGNTTHVSYINCMNFGDISLLQSNKYTGIYAAGGIVGMINGADLKYEKYNYRISRIAGAKHAGTVTAENGYAGSIVGYADFSNSTTRLYTEKNFYAGSVVEIGNSLNLSAIELGYIVGEAATSQANLDFSSAAFYKDMEYWTIENGLGIFDLLYNFTLENGKLRLKAESEREYWTDNGNRAASFSGGDGSIVNPYKIGSAEELALLAYLVNNNIGGWDKNYKGKNYELSADIDLSGKLWQGIGVEMREFTTFGFISGLGIRFTGVFDGCGYEIRGMHSVSQTDITLTDGTDPEEIAVYNYHYAGLFANIGYDAYIRNVNVSEVYSISSNYASGLVAHAAMGYYVKVGRIENCSVTGNVSAQNIAGGIIGVSEMQFGEMEIVGCYNGADVSAKIVGGIIGINGDSWFQKGFITVEACVNTGEISNILSHDEYSKSSVGGIVGKLDYINVKNSVNVGKIQNYDIFGFSGGIAGQLSNIMERKEVKIENCQNIGEITVANNSTYVEYGGIFGGVNELKYYDNTTSVAVSNCAAAQSNICGDGEVTKLRLTEINNKTKDISTFTFTHEYFLDSNNFNCTKSSSARLYMMFFESDTESLILVLGENGEVLIFEAVPKDSDLAAQKEKILAGMPHQDPSKWYEFRRMQGCEDMSESRIIYAVYAVVDRYVTIKFLGFDDELILERYVKYGTAIIAPSYPNDKKIIKTENDVYIFSHWSKRDFVADNDYEVKAEFDRVDRYYTITFVGYDGEELSKQTVEYGGVPDYPEDVSFETNSEIYTFAGWDKSVTSVTANETITADFIVTKKTFVVNFIVDDQIIYTETVLYGESVEQPKIEKLLGWDNDNKFIFNAWECESDFITQNIDIHAVIDVIARQTFNVTYLKANGGVYDVVHVKEFNKIPERSVPEAEVVGDRRYLYLNWDYPATIAKEDIIVKPVYAVLDMNTPIKVVILNENGEIVYSGDVAGAGLVASPSSTFEGLKERYFAGYDAVYSAESGIEVRTQVFKWRLTSGAYVVISFGCVSIAAAFSLLTIFLVKRNKSKTKTQ